MTAAAPHTPTPHQARPPTAAPASSTPELATSAAHQKSQIRCQQPGLARLEVLRIEREVPLLLELLHDKPLCINLLLHTRCSDPYTAATGSLLGTSEKFGTCGF